MRLTHASLKVLRFLLQQTDECSGADVSRSVHVGSGTLYPILDRFESAEWIRRRWEDVEPGTAGRPARHLMALTLKGRAAAVDALKNLQLP